jgi:hypothetical protein
VCRCLVLQCSACTNVPWGMGFQLREHFQHHWHIINHHALLRTTRAVDWAGALARMHLRRQTHAPAEDFRASGGAPTLLPASGWWHLPRSQVRGFGAGVCVCAGVGMGVGLGEDGGM